MDEVLSMNIFKVWSKFVVASIIGVLLNTVYSMVDGIFVGQSVGEAGLASINMVWPAVTIIIGIGLMLGIGGSSIIAIHIGKNDKEKAEETLGTTVASMLAIGFIVMVLGLLFRDRILMMLGAEGLVLEYSRDYYTTIYLISIPYIFATGLNPVVRADGRPQLSMMMIGIGAIANIILDWILVMKLGYGVQGAAIATGASIFISTIVSVYYFTLGKANIKLKKKYFKININILIEIIKIGFVSFAIQLSYGLILFIQNNIMYMYGSEVELAIYSVSTYINCILVNTCMGISQGIQPLIGYHYGAGKTERMKKIVYLTIAICTIGGIAMYGLIIIFGKEIVQIFGISPENIEFAYKNVAMYCLGSPIIGIIFTMSGYYQAVGKNAYANILSIGRGFVLQFILSLILPPVIGVSGVFLSLPLAELLTLIALGVILVIEKHKGKKLTQYEDLYVEERKLA